MLALKIHLDGCFGALIGLPKSLKRIIELSGSIEVLVDRFGVTFQRPPLRALLQLNVSPRHSPKSSYPSLNISRTASGSLIWAYSTGAASLATSEPPQRQEPRGRSSFWFLPSENSYHFQVSAFQPGEALKLANSSLSLIDLWSKLVRPSLLQRVQQMSYPWEVWLESLCRTCAPGQNLLEICSEHYIEKRRRWIVFPKGSTLQSKFRHPWHTQRDNLWKKTLSSEPQIRDFNLMAHSQTRYRPPPTCLELNKCRNKHPAFGDNTDLVGQTRGKTIISMTMPPAVV